MGFYKRQLNQDAVYWAPKGIGSSGKPTFEEPIQIRVRWEDKSEEYIKAGGQTATSISHIFVGDEVKLTGRLWKGLLEDAPTDPFRGVEIQQIQEVPPIRGSSSELMREVII